MPTVRSRLVLLLLAVLLPAGLAAQLSDDDRQARRADLLAADRAASDTSIALGLAEAIGRMAAPDIVLVFPGAPVIAGREAARTMLAGQTSLAGLGLRWVPLYAEVSADGAFGVTWGVTAIASPAQPPLGPLRLGKYLTAWRRTDNGWRMAAHALVGFLPGSAYAAPAGFVAPALPALPTRGIGADAARADAEFAALAGTGAGEAFATFAADDAVTFAGTGELNSGPAAIRRAFAGDDASWNWYPVAGGGSASDDLGFTVGESGITPAGGTTFYGHYLTLWRRAPGRKIRFIADGGSARPAPPRP
jgi:ketosteroid isomerase-like protein